MWMLSDCVHRDPYCSELLLVCSEESREVSRRLRDRVFQAVLNCDSELTVTGDIGVDLDHDGLKSLIYAIGAGILIHGNLPNHFDLGRVRYRTIIIVSEEGPAGERMCEGLIRAFRMYFSPVVEEGILSVVDRPIEKGISDEEFFGRVIDGRTRRTTVVSMD